MKAIHGYVDLYNKKLKKIPAIFAGTHVKGYFDCGRNNLSNLVGSSEIVDGNFWCGLNRLTSLEGIPKRVGGNFLMGNNPQMFTVDDVRKVCDVSGGVFF